MKAATILSGHQSFSERAIIPEHSTIAVTCGRTQRRACPPGSWPPGSWRASGPSIDNRRSPIGRCGAQTACEDTGMAGFKGVGFP